MIDRPLRIATRQSVLAVVQTEFVAARLQALHPGLEVELCKMTTKGDQLLDSPLAKVGGKGLFVKELEQGLLNGEADIAVHSLKDVPVQITEELQLPVVLPRHDPRDAFVSNTYKHLQELPDGARLGSSSLRRQCQIRARYPGLEVIDLRGNIHTRLRKLDEGVYDAIVLATAGLERADLAERVTDRISPADSLPAIGQGVLGIECRRNDPEIETLIAPLHDIETYYCISAERAMNRRLQGGCQVPIAGYATLEGGELYLRALVGHPAGQPVHHAEGRAPQAEAEALGHRVADDLLAQGAGKILAELGLIDDEA